MKEKKKGAAVKTFSLFFSSAPAGPLASQPPPPHDLFHPRVRGWESRTLSVERGYAGEHSQHPHSPPSPARPPATFLEDGRKIDWMIFWQLFAEPAATAWFN